MSKFQINTNLARQDDRGFTLIELLTSMSIMAIITVMSMAAFSSYNNVQVVQSSAADVADFLTLAKSRAISQVVDPQCGNKTLTAYQVVFTLPNQYTFQVVCDATVSVLAVKKLSQNTTFKNTTSAQIRFNTGTGIVPAPGNVVITGYGNTKTITVGGTGSISVN